MKGDKLLRHIGKDKCKTTAMTNKPENKAAKPVAIPTHARKEHHRALSFILAGMRPNERCIVEQIAKH